MKDMFHCSVLLACALAAQALAAAATVDVETSKTFDMRRPRAEDYTSGPKPSRLVRAVLWGVTHNHALGKFEAMKKLKDDYEVVGIVDNSSSKVMRMCEPDMKHYEGLPRFTPEQVLNEVKPDIAVIEVSNQELIDVALKCAKAGIAMHMDKPLGFTLEGFKEVSDICRARNIPLQTGYMFRANDAIQFIVNEGRRGLIGEIFAIDADLSHSYGGKRYIPYSATYPAGTAYLLTCHVIEYVLPMMNERMPEECHSIVMPAPGDPEGTPSHTLTIARWPRTTLTVTVCSKGTQGRRHLRVDGSDGVMELEPIEDFRRVRHTTGEEGGMQVEEVDEEITVKLFLKKAKPPYVRGWNYLVFGKMGDRYAGQLKELAEIVRGERPNPQELYDHDLRVHQLSLQACNIPLAEGKNPVAADGSRIKVALYIDNGCMGGGVIHLARLLKSSPETACDFLGAADVRDGKLEGYDVLVMPGGSGYDRYTQLGEDGFEKIRKYIRDGGCYYGICAGIAMALNDPKRLRLIPYTREKNPLRGGFSAAVKFNARAEDLLGVKEGVRYFRYHDGPIPVKGDPVPDSEYEVLATFESHVMQKGESVTPMYGMPAVIYGRYGKGKVLVSVMHPEYFPSTHDVLGAGFRPLVGRPISFTYPKKQPRPLRVAYYAGEIDRTGNTRAAVRDALALAERPDVDVTFVSGEQIAEGALDHADVLLIPWGLRDKMSQAARTLIAAFASEGRRIVASGAEL